MVNFKTEGVYYRKIDFKTEGYYTKNQSNGKIKKHKYGFWDKLFDTISYGKTLDIAYEYVLFQKNFKTGNIDLKMGILCSDLRTFLGSMKRDSTNHNIYKYEKIDNFILKIIKDYDEIILLELKKDFTSLTYKSYKYNIVEEYNYLSFYDESLF